MLPVPALRNAPAPTTPGLPPGALPRGGLAYYRHAIGALAGGPGKRRPGLDSGTQAGRGPEQTTELLLRARAGDRAAMNALFDRLGPPLHRWAHGRLPGWARGMVSTVDLVQEALLSTFRALQSHGRRDGEDGFAIHAYLRTSLKSRLVDELRRVQRRPVLGEMKASAGTAAESPIEAAIGTEALDRYERALEALDPVSRNAVIARLEMNLPWEDIAGITGKASADAARMNVSRALLRLAEAMDHD